MSPALMAYPMPTCARIAVVLDPRAGWYDADMARHTVRLRADGSLVLPDEVLDELGLAPDDLVVLTREPDGSFRLVNPGVEVSSPGGTAAIEEPAGDRLGALRAARGLWKDREDLPDAAALRHEWDRSDGEA